MLVIRQEPDVMIYAKRLPIVAGLALVLPLAACGDSSAPPAAPPPPTVSVAQPTTRTVTDQDEYVGRFVAIDEVNIHARVSGYLQAIHFTDGQIVKENDLLFTIDQRPFQIALDQAKANLDQAKANLDFTKADLDRASTLLKDRNSTAISKQTFDQRTQAERNAAATVQSQEAAVRAAALDLNFTEIRAPVAGQIGDRRASVGNYVTGGTGGAPTLLAVIVSTNPIRFEFTMDEASLLRMQRRNGGAGVKDAKVQLKLIDDSGFIHDGKLEFLNNVIDRETGTIRARALFQNADGLFRPGMFARIRLDSSDPYEAVVIPDMAIGSEQVKKFVYVVGPDNKVSQKFVTLGPLADAHSRVIHEGLTKDDRVVVNGLMRVRPGVVVNPQMQQAPVPATPAAGDKAKEPVKAEPAKAPAANAPAPAKAAPAAAPAKPDAPAEAGK